MAAILEIPEVRRRVSPLSVQDYHRLDEYNDNGRRTELIRGILIQKISKSPLHSSLAKRLYDQIARMLPEGFVVQKQVFGPSDLIESGSVPAVRIRVSDLFA